MLPVYFATPYFCKAFRGDADMGSQNEIWRLPVFHIFLCPIYNGNLSLSVFLGLF